MKSFSLLRDAVLGWRAILLGDASWRQFFRLTPAGLGAALALYFGVVFIFLMVASLGVGVPTIAGFVAIMVAQALPVVALVLAAWITRRIVPTGAPLLDLAVPGVYALTAYLVLGWALSVLGGPVLVLLWLGVVVLFYKLARLAAGWSRGIAAGFAVLTVLLLVALSLALYMLSGPTAAT